MSSGQNEFLAGSAGSGSHSPPPTSLSEKTDDGNNSNDNDDPVPDAQSIDAPAGLAGADPSTKHHALLHDRLKAATKPSSPPKPELVCAEDSTTAAGSATAPTPQRSISHIQFRSNTIAPSPPLTTHLNLPATPRSHSRESRTRAEISHLPSSLSPTDNTLWLQTDVHLPRPIPIDRAHGATTPSRRQNRNLQHKTSSSSLQPISRTPSLKAVGFGNPFSPHSAASSTVSSPIITAMGDVTPLPSPLLAGDSPGPWKKLGRMPSREAATPSRSSSSNSDFVAGTEETTANMGAQVKRKNYAGIGSGAGPADSLRPSSKEEHNSKPTTHTRNRSISEYIPDPMLIPKRMATVSGTHVRVDLKNIEPGFEGHMRREPHLSEARGLTAIEKPPTPPPSESSLTANDLAAVQTGSNRSRHEYFEAHGSNDSKRRRWRAIKMLGQGTFSRVMLATSQSLPDDDEYTFSSDSGLYTPEPQPQYHRRTLVAVKVCEHGPRGGASEDRIEMSLKRELEIMQCIHHPSLVHLKAWNIEPSRAILVLSYCPGGDLFDIASGHRSLLTPGLLRRIFAELVGAVQYLHGLNIVHRDIKLENVLVNLPPDELSSTTTDWTTYPYSVITLTDLGLSRRIADDERLETRCGSDDYAAPEVIMGQPYDGRATDAWSLGVLLYALLESRLPFDPHPGVGDYAMQMRMRSRTSHRIARVEWRWIQYGAEEGQDGEGDHEADLAKFQSKGLTGAMEVVEGLLKRARTRWPLNEVSETEWVGRGIQVEGGIKFREEEEGEEVL
ncbi:protein kinase [Rhypophila decipiens]|uniref:Protein kinase n=1 Tax=Rhypophila decipiens TaxID=261697 RepID=A0AAN6YG28_9PEZI|nr:protein kinase [Rhypophila decipiens]